MQGERPTERIEVAYTEERWRLFRRLRSEADEMMLPLVTKNIEAIAYGSIARGDVSKSSDIDVFLPRPPDATIIEATLEKNNIASAEREIVQATPSYAAKGYIYISERRSYSFPLVDMKTVELEFFSFAGSVNAQQIVGGVRAPGVDKRLMFIEPTSHGHIEFSIMGREGIVAKALGVSVATVLDRVRTLRRRDRIGRTGVFIKRTLAPEESFGKVFQQLSRDRPAVRRRLRT